MDQRMQEMVGKAELDDDDIKYLRSRPFDSDFWSARTVLGFIRADEKLRQVINAKGEGSVIVKRPADYQEHPTND